MTLFEGEVAEDQREVRGSGRRGETAADGDPRRESQHVTSHVILALKLYNS